MMRIQTSGRTQRPLVALVLSDADNDILFEGYERLPAAAAVINPIFLFDAFCILLSTPSVGSAHREQDRVRIHADTRFLQLDRFLKLGWERFNTNLRGSVC